MNKNFPAARLLFRIKKTIKRLVRFYGKAINYRLKYKYNFLKYSLKIPIKFLYTTLKNEKAGKDALKRLGIMESPIVMKGGEKFYATDVSLFFEQFIEHIYEQFPEFKIKKDTNIVDCGATAGEYTLYALKKDAFVHAIEPNDKAFGYLKKNVKGYKNVKLYQMEISNKTKGKKTTLDKLLKDVRNIDILKIDIEGAEVKALNGAKNTLKKTEKIVMEVHTDKLMKEVKKILLPNFNIKIIKVHPDENSQPLLYGMKK